MSLAGIIAASYVAAGGGSGTVSFVSSTTATATTTINKPAVSSGNLMLWFVTTSSTTWTVAGWTNLVSRTVTVSGNTLVHHVLYRVVDGSEGSTFTGASASVAQAIVAYSGAGTPRVFTGTTQVSGSVLETGLTTSIQQPLAGRVVHAFHAGRNAGGPTLTAPSGPTERANLLNSYWAMSVSDEDVSGAAAVTRTSTASATTAWAALSVFVPASSVAALPYVAGGTFATGNSAAPAVTAPTDLAVGDLLIITAGIIVRTINAVPAGFTAIDTATASSGGGQSLSGAIYYKVATSGDLGATFTWGANASQVWFASATAIRGQNAVSPFLVAPVAGTTSSGVSVSAPTRTATGGPALAVSMLLAGANNTAWSSLTSGTWPFVVSGSGYGGVLVTAYPVASGATSMTVGAVRGASASWLANTVLVAA